MAASVGMTIVVAILTRLPGALPVVLIAASGLILIGVFAIDFILWHRAVRIRVGWAAGIVGVGLVVAISGIGRSGELAAGTASERMFGARRLERSNLNLTEEDRESHWRSVEAITGDLRGTGRSASATELSRLYLYRGGFCVLLGDPTQGLADLNHALALDRRPISALLWRAGLFLRAGCPRYVAGEMDTLIRTHTLSDDLESRFDAGWLLLRYRRDTQALEVAQAVMDIGPLSVHRAPRIKGIALARLGRLEEARDALAKSIERFSLRAEVYFARGLVHRALGNTSDALADIERALRIRPDLSFNLAAQGMTSVTQGRFADGLGALNEAIEQNPLDSYAFQWRGQLLLDLGSPEAARADFVRSMQLRPDFADAYLGLAMVEMALGDRMRATEAFAFGRSLPAHWYDAYITALWIQQLESEPGSPSGAYRARPVESRCAVSTYASPRSHFHKIATAGARFTVPLRSIYRPISPRNFSLTEAARPPRRRRPPRSLARFR